MHYIVKAIKADNGDWVLDVLGVPFGGPDNRDSDFEYFSTRTDLWLDQIPQRPIIYYHGYEELEPAIIGQELSHEVRSDGVWFRVLLDKASEFAARVWQAAQDGLARASSGAISHLVRTAPDGQILVWPLAELSIFDTEEGKQPANQAAIAVPVMKSLYKRAGLTLPDIPELEDQNGDRVKDHSPNDESEGDNQPLNNNGDNIMGDDKITTVDLEQIKADMRAAALEDFKALQAEQDAAAKAEAERLAEVEAAKEEAVKAAKAEWEKEAAKNNRLPFTRDNAPAVGKFGELRKFDNVKAADMALALQILETAHLTHPAKVKQGPSENAYKALAIKLDEAGRKGDNPVDIYNRNAMLKANMPFEESGRGAVKANEVNYSTLATYGDEWVSVAYSNQLWESIRHDTVVADRLPSIEIPQGAESITIPLESTDPTWYKVGQVASDAATGGLSRPAPTVTSSRMGTTSQSLSVAKMGARTRWSGELTEDSLINWAEQLRMQLARSGAEVFEHVIIDGDTATTASTNINDIEDASAQAGTEVYLLFNGFRKLALVTNTANSRSGGAVDEDDFLETLRLMGAAGKNAEVGGPQSTSFILDPNVYHKVLMEITALKTADVYPGNPTIESGNIQQIWGREVLRSYSMHYASRAATGYEYKANVDGKVSATAASNTTGSLLAVRWDQWLLGYKRRMTIEVERFAEWDGYQIVALSRVGMVNRDNEAAAISYNITV